MIISLIIALAFMFNFVSCNSLDNARIDMQENKSVTEFCNAYTVQFLVQQNKNKLAREYICQCTQAGKDSDQNLCADTIRIHNNETKINIAKDCKNFNRCIEILDRAR